MLEPFVQHPIAWSLFGVYLVGTTILALIGHAKTDDLASFAIGKGDMSPIVVGVTLAASIASTATFVINPGFVYKHGLSALLHLGAAAGAGIVTGLLVLSLGFRKVGTEHDALTLPHWLGSRYDSENMTVFYAIVSLLNIFFLVLIVGGLAEMMMPTLGISKFTAVSLIVGFVFSYIFLGGTYAHAFTNTLQGIIMTGIAVVLVASGIHFFSGGLEPVWSTLASTDPNLVETVNPESPLFGSFFSVYIAGYIIGFGLVAQPHVMIKTLYVDSDREMWQAIGVCIVVSAIFLGLLLIGFYSHLADIPAEKFLGPEGNIDMDVVVTVYVTETFSPWLIAVISVVILAAGMSTLDGILVAMSSIVANDLFLNLTEDNLLADKTEEEQGHIAHRFGQGLLIALGLATFVIAWKFPPESFGIFGQVGVYGIVAASAVPILAGILFDELDHRWIFAAATTGLVVHLGLYVAGMAPGQLAAMGLKGLAYETLQLRNPAVTATLGIIASALVAAPTCLRS
jgi:SSS family solute:Na+ symporter/sodium/pantothenate symporter